jgi:nucleotide-binding universal stress UspA family protein
MTVATAFVSQAREIRNILLPIVGSDHERAAIDYATALALALRASITLVYVDVIPYTMSGIVAAADIGEKLTLERAIWSHWLVDTAATLTHRGVVEVKTSCVVGQAVAATIVEIAAAQHFDLIVMATHARTGVSRLVVGSDAEQVMRHAPCPVLTVHMSSAHNARRQQW